MIVLDTGVLLAAADEDEEHHEAAVALLDANPSAELILPATVLTETAWMIESRLDPATEAEFIASVAAFAERLKITTLATLNHRDFRVVRPKHCDAFELLP